MTCKFVYMHIIQLKLQK